MQAAMAARNSSAGLKASGRPLMSVSRRTSASLVVAALPCASIRRALTRYSSIGAISGCEPTREIIGLRQTTRVHHLAVDDDPRRRGDAVAGDGRVVGHLFNGDWNAELIGFG